MPAFAASRLISGPFDEGVIRETAVQLREKLSGKPTFGLVFVSPDYADKALTVLELVRIYGHVPALLGCSGTGLVGQGQEQEEGSGFSLLLVSMPGGKATAISFSQDDVESATSPDFWYGKTGIQSREVKGWLAFLKPYVFNTEPWLKQWNQAYPNTPVFGGRAAGIPGDPEAWVFCNDRIVSGGAALALAGEISVQAVVSQGCKPIGEPLTVTQAERNVLLTLGLRPAYEVLSDVYKKLSDAEREQARGHLFAGLAVSEYLEEHKRGDFLVRNILGADPKSGAVAINALPRVGQTLQYQLRDSQAASDELRRLLRAQAATPGPVPYAGLLCTCNGRGRELFRRANHDAGLINEFFPGLPLAGFSTNTQIGPVGERSFEHGYTASLALLGPAVPG
jgi:small ligand-binding sensory domain FIST